jgi:TonB family protein
MAGYPTLCAILRVMRKRISDFGWLTGLLLVNLFLIGPGTGAGVAQNAVEMPSDPAGLLNTSASVNGLNGTDLKPWHLKVSVQVLNEDGGIKDQGTIEEFWVSEKKYKIIYKSAASTQEEYGTEKGRLRTNAASPLPVPFNSILNEFIDPFPSANIREHWVLDRQQREVSGAKLVCLTVTGFSMPAGVRPMSGMTYCFQPEKPILRISANPADKTYMIRNAVKDFHGHYLPGEIVSSRDGKETFKAHLDEIESIETVNDADFVAPPDAKPILRVITVSAGVAQANLLKSPPPDYPLYAKSKSVQGTVVLQAMIGTDGHLSDLTVVSGPQELRDAALNALRKWVYKPYLLNGQAVSVKTTINVEFRLNR